MTGGGGRSAGRRHGDGRVVRRAGSGGGLEPGLARGVDGVGGLPRRRRGAGTRLEDALRADLTDLAPDVAARRGGSSYRCELGGAPTDAERNTAGLAAARWITADMAFRRSALEAVGGFDERFPRAYRVDADLALRLTTAGYRLR